MLDNNTALVLVLVLLWTLPWKGVALWKAARNRHFIWFIVMLILNSLALVEIVYIFFFSKKKETERSILDEEFLR